MSINMRTIDKDVRRRITKAANSIRRKYLALKLQRSEEDEALNKYLKPITDPLNKLVEKRNRKRKFRPTASEETEDTKNEIKAEKISRIPVKFQPTNVVAETKDDEEYADEEDNDEVFEPEPQDLEELLNSTEKSKPEVYDDYISQYPILARQYVERYLKNSDGIDKNGLKFDQKTESWFIGSLPVDFLPGGDIKVGDKKYSASEGLYKLLFLKDPLGYTTADEDQYRDILNKSGIYRGEDGKMKGNRSIKYKIVKRILTGSTSSRTSSTKTPPPVSASSHARSLKSSTSSTPPKPTPPKATPPTKIKSKTGKALLEYSDKSKELVYYSDVNQLVERLKKLEASKNSGNNNNMNEIFAILEELERLGVIEFYK